MPFHSIHKYQQAEHFTYFLKKFHFTKEISLRERHGLFSEEVAQAYFGGA